MAAVLMPWRSLFYLFCGLLVVLPLAWTARDHVRFDTDLLAILDSESPEILARRLYQDLYLQDHDLILGLESPSAPLTSNAVSSLVSYLSEHFPALHQHLTFRDPWEMDPASGGELAAYVWANSPPRDLLRLAVRLSPANLVQALRSRVSPIDPPSLSPAEARWKNLDPLELGLVPGLTAFPSRPSSQLALHSPDGTLRLILINLTVDPQDPTLMQLWDRRIRDAVSAWQESRPAFLNVRITVCGRAAHLAETRGQLRRELLLSTLTTVLSVLTLVYLAYRWAAPLLFLLLTLSGGVLLTAHLAMPLFGSLNAMSIGFAPILIALAVDYTILVVQHHSQAAKGTPEPILLPIAWATLTTAVVFAGLNLSAVPGLAQFGSLVALGVSLGALLSLTYFSLSMRTLAFRPSPPSWPRLRLPKESHAIASVVACCGAAGVILGEGIPRFNLDPGNLATRPSNARKELDRLTSMLGGTDPSSETIFFFGRNNSAVRQSIAAWELAFQEAFPFSDFVSPALLWPLEEQAAENRAFLRSILARRDEVLQTFDPAHDAGAISFLEHAFDYWERFTQSDTVPPPMGALGSWALRQTIQQDDSGWITARGILHWPDHPSRKEILALRELTAAIPGAILLHWSHIRPYFDAIMIHDIRWVLHPLVALLALLLLLAFRCWKDAVIAIATILTATLFMLACMKVLRIEWTQLNFLAIPLITGVGLDYTIHIIFALRRSQGDLQHVRATMGKALFVCAASSVFGFSSLNLSSHPGLSSLGQICALGVASAFFSAVILLPNWWIWAHRRNPARSPGFPLSPS